MVKVVVHQAQRGKDRLPAGPRALLIWFEIGRKGLGIVTVLRNLTSSC